MKIPPAIYYISFSFSFFSLFSSYFFEITASFFMLILIFRLFWKENTPPIIITGLFFQWLSVSVGYIYIAFSKFEMTDLLWRPDYSLEQINTAFWLSLTGLLFFALGIRVGIRNIYPINISDSVIQKYSINKVIIFYLLFSFFSDALFKSIRFSVPGLAQPLNALLYLKWTLLFLLIYISVSKKERVVLVSIILFVEVIIGFTGYFSVFKDILIIVFIIWLTFNKVEKTKQIVFILLFSVFLFSIGALWSYVKVDYRTFLSGGERTQSVTVSKEDALKELMRLSSQVNFEKYQVGIKNLVKRLFFLEYFSATINHIPEKKPFSDGEIWANAIKHILMPRFLFPNKKSIDDSEQTMKLTGIRLANANQGTSISIGYIAESYADFGSFFMFIPIFLLGFLIGLFYKYLLLIQKNPLWAYGLVIPLYFFINIFGKNIIKIMGLLFWFFIIFNLIVFFFIPLIEKTIKKK